MAQFKDAEGRTWTIQINVSSLRRVKEACGVDLSKYENIREVADDPLVLCDCLYQIIKPQLDNKGLSAEDLAMAFRGDAGGDAAEALIEAMIDFFPSRQRELIRKAHQKELEMTGRVTALAETKLDQAAENLEKKVTADLEKMIEKFGESLPNALESAE